MMLGSVTIRWANFHTLSSKVAENSSIWQFLESDLCAQEMEGLTTARHEKNGSKEWGKKNLLFTLSEPVDDSCPLFHLHLPAQNGHMVALSGQLELVLLVLLDSV